MREVDRLTTTRYGIPSIILMENAAHAVARVITEKLGGSVKGKSILILCGTGNNGGDGAALARILGLAGALVEVVLLGRIKETKGDVRTNLGVLCSEDFAYTDVYFSKFCQLREVLSKDEWNSVQIDLFNGTELIVDAIFGTGLTRPLEIWVYNIIHEINFLNDDPSVNRRLFSVDLPSGLNADTGRQMDIALKADVTVTFTAPKPGNVLPGTREFNGELIVADIGSSQDLIDEQPSQLFLASREDAVEWLASSRFGALSYKNIRGHALVIAGSETYSGAAVLSGNSAIRSGVGLVTLACPAEAETEIASRLLPEVILATIGSKDFDELAPKANAVAIGPGLSATDAHIERLVMRFISERTRPTIVDAGALWFINLPDGIPQVADVPLILTPHEGEFMRLLGTDDKSVIEDRVAAVRKFSQDNNVILVLKGERVLIGEPGGKVVVNPTGNSGLGKAGNGDTLTGILAGFVAQAAAMKIDTFETVVAAVFIAGLAGDIAEKKFGKRVITASDVRECLTDAFDRIEDK